MKVPFIDFNYELEGNEEEYEEIESDDLMMIDMMNELRADMDR